MPVFFSTDLLGLALALLLGVPLIVIPGYGLGWWMQLLRFREQKPHVRWALALLLGVSLTPVLLYLAHHLVGIVAVWILMTALFLGGIAALFAGKDRFALRETPRSAVVVSLVWLAIVVFVLLDLATANRVIISWVAFDHSYRSEVIAALSRAETVPPTNYFFYPGHPVEFRYHYFSYLFGALMVRLGRGLIPARIALDATVFWFGLSLLAMVWACFAYFVRPRDIRRFTRMAWLLMAVMGLDLVPIAIDAVTRILQHRPDFIPVPTVDWWNSWGQVTSWIDTALWVPNHTSGLVACVVGCLILWDARNERGRLSMLATAGAALAFASGAGLSIYVTLVFAVFLVPLSLIVLSRNREEGMPMIFAGAIAAVILFPFLIEIRPNPNVPVPPTFVFSVRPFQVIGNIFNYYNVRSVPLWNLANFVALPLNYLIELGMFFLVGLWWLWNLRKRPEPLEIREKILLGLFAVSFLVSTFIHSGSPVSNDLSWRGILPVQLILLFAATEFFNRRQETPGGKVLRRWVVIATAIGVLGMVFELGLLRTYVLLSDAEVAERHELLLDEHTAERFKDLRNGYEWIRSNTPANAIVQENPSIWQELPLGLYAERRTSVFGRSYSPISGGHYGEFLQSFGEVRPVFKWGARWDLAVQTCAELGITHLVMQDTDSVWHDKNSFVWSVSPVFAGERVRIFECR